METKEILYIDDDCDDFELLEEVLTDIAPGVALVHVKSGSEAMDYLASRVPGLIVLDFNIPQMDGGEILRWIQLKAGLKEVPVAIFSTTHIEYLQKALHNASIPVLSKPSSQEELRAAALSFVGMMK